MAKVYFEKLSSLIEDLNLKAETTSLLEVRHFFSGAALYAEGVMCASLSSVGLAFKLTEVEVEALIRSGQAAALKYFPKGHIKKGYVLFEAPDLTQAQKWKHYFHQTILETISGHKKSRV